MGGDYGLGLMMVTHLHGAIIEQVFGGIMRILYSLIDQFGRYYLYETWAIGI